MFLPKTAALLAVFSFTFRVGYTQPYEQYQNVLPLHCIDKNSKVQYNIGQSWSDQNECVKYDCEHNPANGAAFTVATMCAEDKTINKNRCYKLPGKPEPFPACCPRWTCLGGGNLKTIVQEKPPIIYL